MSDPSSLRRPRAGRSYDPTAIDATGATLGDYLGAVDDGSGGQRAGYLPLPVTPGDVDPGVGTGTPGNWSHNFVPVDDAGSFVLGAHDDDPEPLGVAKLLKFLLPGAVLRGQATVLVKGAVTAYLDFRVSPDRGATWETDLLGVRVPLRDADDEITANGFTQAIGLAIEVPAEFEGEVLLDPVVVGGNGTDVPEIQSFVLESTSEAPPPADGEGGPVTAGIPQTGSVLAYWQLTEGGGETVANKMTGSGGAPVLAVGTTTSAGDGFEPTWATGPRRMQATSLGGFTHQLCRYAFTSGEAAALANGFAIFLPFKPTAGPGDKYAFGIFTPTGSVRIAEFLYDNTASRVPTVLVLENSGGSGTNRTVSGTTPIDNGDWHLLGLVFTGTTLKIVVDGAVEGSTACSAAVPGISGTYIDFGWPGTNGSFTNGPDACDFGDPLMYVDAGIDFTDDELAGMYEEFKLTYPLP